MQAMGRLEEEVSRLQAVYNLLEKKKGKEFVVYFIITSIKRLFSFRKTALAHKSTWTLKRSLVSLS